MMKRFNEAPLDHSVNTLLENKRFFLFRSNSCFLHRWMILFIYFQCKKLNLIKRDNDLLNTICRYLVFLDGGGAEVTEKYKDS